jgi:hypothetical protein
VKLFGGFQHEEGRRVTRFTLNEFSQTFATRERGTELREELVHRAGSDKAIVVDFDGVTNISYSFADEFLGKLFAEGNMQVTVENAMPGVARIAGRAVERRAGTAVSC